MDTWSTIHVNAGARDGTLREKRLALELTQQQVADKAKIALSSYQKFESGERNIRTASFDLACRVITALGMDPTAFYEGEYVFGEPTIFDQEGRKYVRSGRLVDEDVEDTEALNVMRIHICEDGIYVPMKILRAIDSPRYIQLVGNKDASGEDGRMFGIKVLKQPEENAFRIPDDTYCGRWRGICLAHEGLMADIFSVMGKPVGTYTGEPRTFEKGALLDLGKMEISDYRIPVEKYYLLKLENAQVE